MVRYIVALNVERLSLINILAFSIIKLIALKTFYFNIKDIPVLLLIRTIVFFDISYYLYLSLNLT